MIAAIKKRALTIGILIINIADIAKFKSMMYLSKGNSLLPIQPNKYLYPSASSVLLKINVRILKAENKVENINGIDSIPGTMKVESILNEVWLLNTEPAVSA